VDEVIRAWVKEASENRPGNAQHLDGGNEDQGPIKTEQITQAQGHSLARPSVNDNQQKAKQGGTANGKSNGVATSGKSNTQKTNEVITLD